MVREGEMGESSRESDGGGKRKEEEGRRGVGGEYLEGGVCFFKQKTACEMLRGHVGSEVCIRDRSGRVSV